MHFAQITPGHKWAESTVPDPLIRLSIHRPQAATALP
jgi:hypothetical protein